MYSLSSDLPPLSAFLLSCQPGPRYVTTSVASSSIAARSSCQSFPSTGTPARQTDLQTGWCSCDFSSHYSDARRLIRGHIEALDPHRLHRLASSHLAHHLLAQRSTTVDSQARRLGSFASFPVMAIRSEAPRRVRGISSPPRSRRISRGTSAARMALRASRRLLITNYHHPIVSNDQSV